MKLFGRDSKKKQQKKANQDVNSLTPLIEGMPPPPTLANQDPVYDQRLLQQPAPATAPYPPRTSRPPKTRRPVAQSQPPPVTTQVQQAPVKQSREHSHRHTVKSQPPPAQTQAPVRYSEAPLETLRQAPPMTQAADPPQVFTASQAPTLKESPSASLPKDSVGALKESFGIDPAAQMAHNAVTRELVKQFIADIWNRGDLDLIPKVCAKGIRFNGSVGMDRVGRDGFKRMVTTIRSYLEDYHCEIHSMVVEGNKAFCRIRFMGRHTGMLLGYKPTGRQVSWMGAMEFTVQDNKIIKVWELGDMSSLEQQLREDKVSSSDRT